MAGGLWRYGSGAGAAVVKDVKDGETVVGVPAKQLF